MDRKIKIKGKDYKVASNFLAFKRFAKRKGLNKLNEVSAVLDSFGKVDLSEMSFEMLDDLAMFILSCIEAGEGTDVEMTVDDLQMEFLADQNMLKNFFEAVNEAISGDAEPGKPNRAVRRAQAKKS